MSEEAQTETTETVENPTAIFEEDRKPAEETKETAAEETTEEKPAEETVAEETQETAAEETTEEVAEEAAEETEEFEISLPEGSSLDPVHAEEIAAHATELGLTVEQAQAWLNRESEIVADMLENAHKIVQEQSQATMEDMVEQWGEILEKDPEIGGDKLKETQLLSDRFVEAYFPEELVTWLSDTKFGKHPEAIRAFSKAAKALNLAGDSFEGGTPPGSKEKKTDAQLFYGDNAK